MSVHCGSEHLFAISNDEAVWGWGRNEAGQLGMGFLSVSVPEPTLVKSLKAIIVKKIQCGDNYSACITSDRKLLVTGEIDGGKLGIGKSWITGCILSFKEVPTLQNVGKVACGPNHMLAIVKDSKDKTSKKTSVFAWGRNWRG